MGLLRRRRPPVAVRRKMVRDERVLAWAPAPPDAAVVVTTLGVWLPDRDERLGWHRIHKATWSGPRLTIVPSMELGTGDGYLVMADDTPVEVVLSEPGEVPSQVRTRVSRSVAYTAHYPLPGGGVRVVGRRVPGVNGLTWHVRYDAGTDADDPEVVAATAKLVAESSPTTAP